MALPLAQVPIAPSIATPIPVPQAPPATPIPVPPVNAGFDPDAYLKEVATTAVKPEADAFDPDSYVADEAKKYVDDDDFDPLTLAYEQPDKKEFAKEIEFRKSQRPMTGARAGKAVKNFGKAIPGIVEDFGKGFGNIIADSYIQATDDNPANVERAKTQQLARAQLIESHGSGFLNKLFGPDSWIGSHVARSPESIVKTAPMEREQIQKMYGHAKPGSEIDQIRVAELARVDKEEAEAQAKIAHGPETPRQKSDRMFEEKLAQVHKEREILKGVPQPDGIVAELTKGAGQATHRLITGEAAPEDMYHVEDTFKTGAQLAAMNAPIDEEAIRTGAVTADPINLAPLNLPKMVPLANKVGGALLKAPAYLTSKVVENTPEVISAAAKKRILGAGATAAGGAVAYEALKDPAAAAKHLLIAGAVTTGVAGAKYFGRVMDVAGSKMLNPKFVSAAEKAAAESAMNIEKAGGSKVSKFFDPAMNRADIERALVRPLQGAVSAPIAMAPLNAAISENPEEFAALSGTATGFGLFGGATAYNPIKGFHPETVAAVDSLLRDQGAKKKYGTPLDAQHEAFMEKAPEGVRDAVNSYRGFFDGFKLSSGREPQIYVLPSAEFGAEVSKRRPDVTPDHAAKQRGFIGKDGAILINGDYGGEAPGILGHEAGGHAAMSIMEVLLPEISKSMEAAARTGLTDGKGNPTPQMRKFVEAYNKEFDPTGKRKEIKTETQAINEWLAEQARAVLDGQGPAKYAAGNSVRQKIADNLGDHFQKVFGTKRAFDRSEVPAVARQYRDLLFQLGRLRGQEGPETAPEPAPGEPAAAPASEPAAPAPAGARPAAEPAAPMPGDRATVAAALRSLFGVKQAEADAMAAAATGSTVEEMIASAAQAKSKANAGSSTVAPAAQPAPLQPAGQLAGVAVAAEPAGAPAAPAAQLAGFGEPAPAPKAKIFVRRLPDGTFVDRQGNPVDPRTGLAPEAPNLDRGGAAAPPEAPARPVVTPEDLAGRVQAAEDAARAAEAGKKRKTPESRERATAQAVKEARIQALLDAAHEAAPDESHLQRREEFGTVKFTGRIDESIPAHRMLLDELGVSEGGRSNIDTLSANLGKPVFIRYKSAAKEGSSEAAQASGQVDRTGKQRAKEYKAESVDSRIEDAQAGDVNTGVEQTKSFYPLGFRVNPSTGSVTVTGFSPQRLLSNVGKIVEFMRGKGRETGYTGADDPAIHEDMQGYAQNHANGYKGDGSGPIAGETPNEHYDPYIFQDHTRFDLLNAAMGNERAKNPKRDTEGAKARAGDLQDFAAANDTLVTPEGETNPLRQWLNENGFEFKNEAGETRAGTKDVLEPTIESLRVDPELMREISTEAPESETSLRPTGVRDPSAMTAQGIPKARNVAAGFMPGKGDGQLGKFMPRGEEKLDEEFHDFFTQDGDKAKSFDEVEGWLKSHGKDYLTAGDKIIYDGHIIDVDYEKIQPVREWLGEAWESDKEAMAEELGIKLDFNKDFWERPETLYHATADDNIEGIDKGGLGAASKTRGISNRSVGDAVYTSSDFEELAGHGSYGDKIYEIDTDAMKRDGFTPEVSREPAVEEAELTSALAHKLGLRDWENYNEESDMSPTTVVIHGNIPQKYVKRSNFMPGQGAEKGQLSEFGGDRDESSIESKVGDFMPGQSWDSLAKQYKDRFGEDVPSGWSRDMIASELKSAGDKPEEKQLQGFDRKPKTDELGFYSRLRQHVDEADFGRSKPKAAQHWLGVIEKWAKGASTPTLGVQSRGIARDELEWSGVKEWLKSQGSTPIKKADVLSFIDRNGVQVQEVQKGGGSGEDAFFMDDELYDNGDTGGDGGNLWTIDAYPNREHFGEGAADRIDTKPMAFISMKQPPKHGVILLNNGKFKAYHGDESIGTFDSKEEAHEALVEEYGEPVDGEPDFEVWDGPSNSHYRTFSSLEQAEQAARELARENLRSLNEEHAESGEGVGDTQFSGYKLDGGTNYKEVLLKLPVKESMDALPEGYHIDPFTPTGATRPSHYIMRNAEGRAITQGDTPEEAASKAVKYLTEGGVDKNLMRRQPFTESHWSEPNVVAHFRQQDFEGMVRPAEEGIKDYMARGGNSETEKVRHIDEFQSDWHQKGRERGYESPETIAQKKEATAKRDALKKQLDAVDAEHTKARDLVGELSHRSFEKMGLDSYADILKSPEKEKLKKQLDELRAADPEFVAAKERQEELHQQVEDLSNQVNSLNDATRSKLIPDAPFKKTWSQLAFKRALKLAVEDGMDRMSWSTGDQNIEHYKRALVAEVDKVTWTHPMPRFEHGTKVDEKVVTLSTNHHGALKFSVGLDGEILKSYGDRVGAQFVGKSLAEVIGKENAKKVLEPGGEGEMNGEGMEVGGDGMRTFYDEMIPQFARQYVAKWNSKVEDAVLPTGDTVHSVKITPEMKAAVDRGQPMFMPGSRGAEQAAGGKKQLEDFGKPDKLGFYSGLARTIDAKVPSKASGEQILNTLKGAGAKAEELEYTGLPEFLKSHDGPVTKQELQEFVKAGGVQFKEVVKRKVDWPMEKSKRLAELDQKERRGPLTEAEGEEYVRLMEEERDWQDSGPAPRYEGYQVPGGKNYKEILLTLPTAKIKSDAFMRETLDPESLAIYENQDDPSSTFRTNHWDEPNVLAHIRQADHTDAEGNKVRLIEEIQSDWHQKGRKEGYQGDNAKKMKALGVRERELSDRLIELRRKGQLSPEEITEHDSLADESRKLSEQIYALNQQGGVSGVPDAPFKKSWAELAFKRALRLAAEDGMDKIAWTPGEEQARRYKEALVREVSGIEWDELQNTETVDGKLKITPSGQKAVTIKTPSGGDVKLVADSTGKIIRSTDRSGFGQQFVGKGLDDVIGKDNAEKIMGDKHGDLDAEGMSVGGDGMKGFYDKILPDFVRKYVRKWGGKVENGEVSTAAKYQFSPVRAKDGYGKQIKLEDGSDAYVLQDIASGDYLADKAQNTRAGRPQDGQLFSKVDADAIADKKVADFSQNVWSVDITPQMREAVMQEGQPMFMPGKGPEKPAGDLSDFGGDNESSIKSKVEWAQPKRAKAAGDVVVNVKTSAFDEAFQKDHGFYIDKDGNGEIKGRRDRFKEFLKEGKAIEMPEVVITKEGTAAFVNGRHRFSVMRDAGVESVPMSMDETSALRAQTLGMTVEAKSNGGDLGSFMPSDETGRGEFDVKEKKPVDERRARLMADMQGQAKWLTDRAKEKGFDSVDDLMAEDFEGYNELAKQWREEHPRFNAAGEQLFMPGKMEGATPEEREANFSKWTGDAPVIRVGDSLHDVEPGQPVVIEGFHGTTHDFTAVDTSKANIENDWGKGFYVTNTPEDVENNYAGEGPDLTQRIEKRAERVEQELEDMEPADISRVFGITPEQAQAIVDGEGKGYGTPEYKSRQEALKVIAKKELTTHGGSTMKVFVKLENPLKLGEGSGKEGYWDAETPMDEETGDPDGEPTGKLVDFIEALREVSRDYDEADIDSADDLNQLIWDGGAKPSDALAAAKKALQYATDPETGDSATSEILRAAVEQMGYDGIIDETVNDKFGSNKATGKAMTGMDDYTFHVIAFRPESVKSATGNRGTFDGSNPDMTMMPGNSARRTWFMRNGKRVYHHRGEAGQFAEKPALAKLGVSAISQKKDDNAKAQLETFK